MAEKTHLTVASMNTACTAAYHLPATRMINQSCKTSDPKSVMRSLNEGRGRFEISPFINFSHGSVASATPCTQE